MIGDATSFNSEDKGVYKFLVEVNELKAWKNFDSQKMLNSKKNKKNGLMNGLSNDQSMEDILSLSSLSKDQVPYIFSDSKSNEMLKESVLNKDNLQFKFTNPSLSMPSSGIVSQLDESMINYSNTFEQPDTINPIKSQNKYDSTKQPVTHQSKNEDLTFLKNQIDAISAIIPVPQDSSRLFQRIFSNRSPVSTPEYYPTTMAFEVLNFETFRKFSTELLFTLFYRYEGTLIQKLAAKALKNQSWRFHTNYKLWFQRLQEPKTMTDEYEHGSYIYFDIEKWAKRNKDGFTFEYKYLEDRKL
ncbi:MAG: CCR4-NOT transcription complex, subunit 3 [Paramarteilia canceri]